VRRRWSPALVFLHFTAAQLALLAAAVLIVAPGSEPAADPQSAR